MAGIKENNSLLGYKNIKIAVYIFCITQITIFIKQFYDLYGYDLQQFVPMVLEIYPIAENELIKLISYAQIYMYAILLVSFFSMIFIIFKTSQGKEWARILLIASCVISYIFIVFGFIYNFFILNDVDWVTLSYKVIISAFEIYALFLILDKKTTHLFK